MNQSIEARMQYIEDELKQIRKELEESLLRYKNPIISPDVLKLKDSKCLWDSIPVEDRYKPMGLSCPCRKCSAWC